MVRAKKFVLLKPFEVFPKQSDVKIIEEELPPLKNGEFLAKAEFLSVDPYMKFYINMSGVGSTLVGTQVAKIVESKCPEYPIGRYVVGQFGWRTHTITTPNLPSDNTGLPMIYLLPELDGLSPSLGISAMGIVGNTAYFGFLEICKPKKGETVVVSGAAGGVGSLVGQIAKIKGCRVIGIAGTDEKGKCLVEELGFDAFINYKNPNLAESLREVAPNGVDCYFDNVGGEISEAVMQQMNEYGRVSICGIISMFKATEATLVPPLLPLIVMKQLRIEGFVVKRWNDKWMEGILQMKQWIEEGKLKSKEAITNGFENMFDAFVNMLRGGNTGKAIVQV